MNELEAITLDDDVCREMSFENLVLFYSEKLRDLMNKKKKLRELFTHTESKKLRRKNVLILDSKTKHNTVSEKAIRILEEAQI